MKTQKHTPGPLVVSAEDPVIIETISGEFVAMTLPCEADVAAERDYANAARIVACVNACEGINPEAVPMMLDALRECITEDGAHCLTYGTNTPELRRRIAAINEIARAAIAAATKDGGKL